MKTCRVPSPANSASSRRRRIPKQIGNSQPLERGRRSPMRPGLRLEQRQVVDRIIENAQHRGPSRDGDSPPRGRQRQSPDGVDRPEDGDLVMSVFGGD